MLRYLGVSAASLPFLCNLNSLRAVAGDAAATRRRKRLVVVFSPNGVIPDAFWPEKTSLNDKENAGRDFELTRILEPLAPFKDQLLTLKGLTQSVKGDGDGHMRGIGCMLTGIELFPGNIQGGSHTPAGWAKGISLDQQLRNQLQAKTETATRFGSLEFGVMVPDRADTWTRMSYAGANQPVAPISDPFQMFDKLYGSRQDQATLRSVMDSLLDEFKSVRKRIGAEDRQLLEQHTELVRGLERDLAAEAQRSNDAIDHAIPTMPETLDVDNDHMPEISRLQIEMLVSGFAADFNRIATLQYTNSVGGAKMRWLGVEKGHHQLSHQPDSDSDAKESLTKINVWFAQQIALLCKRLSETPEPDGSGTSLLDNTQIVWTNELGKGNSHTHDNIPWVLVGGGCDFDTGRSLDFAKTPHNR
ncbi:MAG: DUF1552 domain-containing protein, partial [Planctomycetota bacterium]